MAPASHGAIGLVTATSFPLSPEFRAVIGSPPNHHLPSSLFSGLSVTGQGIRIYRRVSAVPGGQSIMDPEPGQFAQGLYPTRANRHLPNGACACRYMQDLQRACRTRCSSISSLQVLGNYKIYSSGMVSPLPPASRRTRRDTDMISATASRRGWNIPRSADATSVTIHMRSPKVG
jgi:hypothetical protein